MGIRKDKQQKKNLEINRNLSIIKHTRGEIFICLGLSANPCGKAGVTQGCGRGNSTRRELKCCWQNLGFSLIFNFQCPACSGSAPVGRFLIWLIQVDEGKSLKEFCPGNADYWCFLHGTPTAGDAFTLTLWIDLLLPNKAIPSRIQPLGPFPVPHQAKHRSCHHQDSVSSLNALKS